MNSAYFSLNSPLWTLIHEWRISLLFPLILPAVRRWPIASMVGALVASLGAKTLISTGAVSGDVANLAETVAQTWYFIAGALLAKHWSEISDRVLNLKPVLVGAWATATLCLLLLKWLSPAPSIVTYFATGVGAISAVVIAGASLRGQALFGSSVPVFAGRLSYSLYAVHFPVIFATVLLLGRTIGLPLSLFLGLGIAICLAMLINRWVEDAATSYGRRLADALAPPRSSSQRREA